MKRVDDSSYNPTITQSEYSEMVKKASPNSPIVMDCLKAFLVGGIICVIAQLIMEAWIALNLKKDDAAMLTSSAMIFLGALLTGLNIYDNIALIGKAGTLVPITGFANSIVSPAMEYKTEGYIMGVGIKMFTIAGPVLVYGIVSAVVYGIIYSFIV